MSAWMQSAGHRANILLPAYREVGFGVVAGNPSTRAFGATFVTEFGVVERSAGRSAPRRGSARQASRDRRAAARRRAAGRRAKHKARMRARRSRARRARIALAPQSRKRLVGRIKRASAGLG